MEQRRHVVLAYNIALLTRTTGRMPSLESMLRGIDGAGPAPTQADVDETQRIADEGALLLEEMRRRKLEKKAREIQNDR